MTAHQEEATGYRSSAELEPEEAPKRERVFRSDDELAHELARIGARLELQELQLGTALELVRRLPSRLLELAAGGTS